MNNVVTNADMLVLMDFFAPSMWCVKHKTNDGECFIKEFGGGTGCDDFEEGKIWDYYTY